MPPLPPFLINEYPPPFAGNPRQYGDFWEDAGQAVGNFFTGADVRKKEDQLLESERESVRRLEQTFLDSQLKANTQPPAWAWALLIVTAFGAIYAVAKYK